MFVPANAAGWGSYQEQSAFGFASLERLGTETFFRFRKALERMKLDQWPMHVDIDMNWLLRTMTRVDGLATCRWQPVSVVPKLGSQLPRIPGREDAD